MFAATILAAFITTAVDGVPGSDAADLYDGIDPRAMLGSLPLKTRSRDIAYLMRVLEQSPENEYRAGAARMLGEIRASTATRTLLKSIKLRTNVISKLGPLSMHPAAHSLVQIGNSIYPEFFGCCQKRLDDLEIKLFAFVVRGIDGREVGEFRLRDKLRKYEAEMKDSLVRTGVDSTNSEYVDNLNSLIILVGGDDLDKIENAPWNLRPLGR